MQLCTAENINNKDQNNVSPIWRRVLFNFRQIAKRFDYGAIGDRRAGWFLCPGSDVKFSSCRHLCQHSPVLLPPLHCEHSPGPSCLCYSLVLPTPI